MDIVIQKADLRHLEDCKEALVKSELGRQYFPVEANALSAVKEGIGKDEIYIAQDEKTACLGFIWFIPKGAFHSFPYLHILAVKEEYRGKGIGKALICFFEETVSAESSKVFLVVADFNPRAKKLYEQLGYSEVGALPDLYRKGITEYLLMKAL